MSGPAVGSRVELVVDVERYPHFIAPAGASGVVVDHGDPQIILAVRLDEPLAGAEDWSNEVHWLDGDADLNDMDVDEYLALYVREVADPGGDYVQHAALRAASVAELVGIIDAGGPTALIRAAHAELDERRGPENAAEAAEQDAAYERASADVVLPLTREDARTIADALEYLAGVDEGENTPYDDLVRLALGIRGVLAAS